MVQSDALPTELRGTCQQRRWNFKACFRRLTHCKDQAWKHTCYSIGRREFSLQWFAIDSNSEKKLFPLRFAIFMKVYLSSLIRESQWGYPIVVKQQNAMR